MMDETEDRLRAFVQRIARTDGLASGQFDHLRVSQQITLESVASDPDDLLRIATPSVRRRELAAQGFEKVLADQGMSREERISLEAIIIPKLRPAFDVAESSFGSLPAPWTELNQHRSFIETCIRGIGRLNLTGHPLFPFVGTAFVVGPNTLLTNRHVAEIFVRAGAGTLEFSPGITPSVDLRQEVASSAVETLGIVAPILILDEWDAALLRLSSLPVGVTPLRLAAQPPAPPKEQTAAVVGYPKLDSTQNVQAILQQIEIFRGVFDKKRLQPGHLMGFRQVQSFDRTVEALAHDCSTLGGNSGSALIDVVNERVVGLHFGGVPLVANFAVPSWELAKLARLRDVGAEFV